MKWVMEYMYETWGLISGIVDKHFKSMIWYKAETCDQIILEVHLKEEECGLARFWSRYWVDFAPSEVILKKGKLENIMEV